MQTPQPAGAGPKGPPASGAQSASVLQKVMPQLLGACRRISAVHDSLDELNAETAIKPLLATGRQNSLSVRFHTSDRGGLLPLMSALQRRPLSPTQPA